MIKVNILKRSMIYVTILQLPVLSTLIDHKKKKVTLLTSLAVRSSLYREKIAIRYLRL
jgi:hypothetical protein